MDDKFVHDMGLRLPDLLDAFYAESVKHYSYVYNSVIQYSIEKENERGNKIVYLLVSIPFHLFNSQKQRD